jgi:putative oxidoreductase
MTDLDALNLGLLVFRIVVAIVFLAHGIRHIYGGGKIEGTGRWFESLGMKPGIVHAWVASLTEIGAGVCLILGLFTPLAAAGVTATMAVAWITNHLKNGFFIFAPGEGYEYVMTLTFAGFLLATVGAGEWSVDDALFDGFINIAGVTGLLIWLVAGVGGAAALLATCWRPAPKES